RIIYLLRAKEMTVSQIAGELNLTPQAIYHHIRKLRDAGMVEVAREERVDHFIETYYRATAEIFNMSHGSGTSSAYHEEKAAESLEFADFLARNHDALDLGRPFPYLKDLRIPHPLLHGLVLHVAGPSEDLDGVRGDFHRDVRREQFRHARLLVHREASVVHRGGAPRQEPGRIHLRLHVREHERDRLLLCDRGAEGLPFPRIVECVFVGGPRDTHRTRGHERTGRLEGFHGAIEGRFLVGTQHVS